MRTFSVEMVIAWSHRGTQRFGSLSMDVQLPADTETPEGVAIARASEAAYALGVVVVRVVVKEEA